MKQCPEWVEFMREQYPPGTRIRVREMNDPHSPVPPGTEGTVERVDDGCNIHMKWDNGRTLALIPGEDKFSVIAPKLTQLKLYMPLTINQYERDEYGSFDGEPTELDCRSALAYEGNILKNIKLREMPEEAERGLMHWYHEKDSVNDKVASLRPTVEVVDGGLMGVAVCMVAGELTAQELDRLKEYTAGQMSDGWGEGFEQREIVTAEGEVYVSFWSSDRDWSIQTEAEMCQPRQAAEHSGHQMGGMELG